MEAVKNENRAQLVESVLRDCLYREEEITKGKTPSDAIIVEGVMGKFGFHPGRIAEYREEIRELLKGLPKEFYKQSGGGYTFLNLCIDANGDQWGEQRNVNEICVLAIAAGFGKWCLPREMWSILPGSMPYVVFDIE